MKMVEDHRMMRIETRANLDSFKMLKAQSRLSHSTSSKQQETDNSLSKTDHSDGTLLEQSLAGDESAFEVLFSRYYPPLLKYIRRILQDEEQACVVLQFVFF